MTIREKFRSAIKRGTGEAHLVMKANPGVNFYADIIKATVKNLSYHNQSEGSRAVYIFELIELSNQKERIKQVVLKALAAEKKDAWALVQLFDIAALFAKQRDKAARKAMYKRFYKKPIYGSAWAGSDAILNLDGMDGLKFIAATIGKKLLHDSEEWEDGATADYFQWDNPRIDVYGELKKSSLSNPYIKKYLDTIAESKLTFKNYKGPLFNYEYVSERITKGKNILIPKMHVKELSRSAIKQLSDDFLKEKSRVKQEKYMQVFSVIKFPYTYKEILFLAQSKYSSKDRLIEFAVLALKYFTGKDIRQFALEKMISGIRPGIYANLLIANFRDADSNKLKRLVDRPNNMEQLHGLAGSLIKIYSANKSKTCKGPLTVLYNKLTCGQCREEIIKIMIANQVLPARINNEIQYDSYEETRKLYKSSTSNLDLRP